MLIERIRDVSKPAGRADGVPIGFPRLQTETIYRWELGLAWEIVQQIALTRNCLFLAAQSEPSMQGWIQPDADAFVALGESASAVNLVRLAVSLRQTRSCPSCELTFDKLSALFPLTQKARAREELGKPQTYSHFVLPFSFPPESLTPVLSAVSFCFHLYCRAARQLPRLPSTARKDPMDHHRMVTRRPYP